MTLDFFLKTFDFNDLEILDIKLENHVLKMEVIMQAHIDLIANGYRPELDMEMKKIFEFNDVNVKQISFIKPYSLKLLEFNNEKLTLNICNNILVISGKTVNIISI